jgi:hypothetical protein
VRQEVGTLTVPGPSKFSLTNFLQGARKMSNLDKFDDDKNLSIIEKDSRERRAAPLKTFVDFLERIWMDNTEEEALFQWQRMVKNFPLYARDYLYCIDAVIANPPENLVEIMEDRGWLILSYNYDQPDERPYTDEEYYEWLKQMRDEFRAIYNKANLAKN